VKKPKIRFAVVGQGHIAQVAVLPGFKKIQNAELTALVSGDPFKLRILAKKYGVRHTYSYEQYDKCLKSGEIDAVYIALPNQLHKEYAIRAAEAGIHVLCEKPLAVTSRDAEAIVRATKKSHVKLMVAYRLHLDPANLKTIQLVQSGKIGALRYFTSEFGYELKLNNLRMDPKESEGPLHDIGIYCINAARYLFKAEPTEVFAYAATPDKRYAAIQETVSAVMKFAEGQLATFTCSFGSGAISNYRVVGTHGDLFLENPYEYVGEITHRLTVREKTRQWKSQTGDQFAAELKYFSKCIQNNREPVSSGLEGITDVRIVEALYRSIETGKPVALKPTQIRQRPSMRDSIRISPHREPKLLKVQAASK
jgi:predicted dehydrogenase